MVKSYWWMPVENLSLFTLIYLKRAAFNASGCWESFIIHLDILSNLIHQAAHKLRIFHYSPWYTYWSAILHGYWVENLSLFTLIYLARPGERWPRGWESFIIHLDILKQWSQKHVSWLRIFHYSPWYTYHLTISGLDTVENLSLFTLIYLTIFETSRNTSWESFIIHLDILNPRLDERAGVLRIFHYSPWYTYGWCSAVRRYVENLSLFTLIYLRLARACLLVGWESFIIHLDILIGDFDPSTPSLRIFHYSPWYTYHPAVRYRVGVENLSLFTLIYLRLEFSHGAVGWESFIIHLDILTGNVKDGV